MPDAGGYFVHTCHQHRADRVKAKLKKLGLDPRSKKYNRLYFRFLHQRGN